MAIFGMVLVQVIALKENGFRGHVKHYFPLKAYNPLTYLIGAFEIFTEFTRLLSLGLRLFLNIAIGEVLISVAAYLGGTFAAPIAALPFTLLEIFVGALQAYIFVVLCAAYLAATTAGHGDEHQEEPHQGSLSEGRA
jgi:F-type H+-transporting ATPase subunit a